MVKKSSKKVNVVEDIQEELIEPVEEVPRGQAQEQEINENIQNDTEEQPQEPVKPVKNIKTILENKKVISEKQKSALEKLRKQRVEKEKLKKNTMKKVDKLISLGINLDELIENGEKNKLKKDYEENFGVREEKDIDEYEKPVEKVVENYEKNNGGNSWFSW